MVVLSTLYLNTLIPGSYYQTGFFVERIFFSISFVMFFYKPDSANLETLFVIATIATRQQNRHKIELLLYLYRRFAVIFIVNNDI